MILFNFVDIEEQKDSKSKKGESTDTGKEGKKKTKRRSLRLKKKDEVMEVIDLGSPEPVAEETSSGDNKQETGIDLVSCYCQSLE